MGASGSGKSTLLHLLGCLDRPSAGAYRLDGTAVESLSDAELSRLRNQRIGFVFQTFNLIFQHNVLENGELPLIYGGICRKARPQKRPGDLPPIGPRGKIRPKTAQLPTRGGQT